MAGMVVESNADMATNRESGAFHHHRNQVLANIVQVTLDGSDEYLSLRGNIAFLKERFEQFRALLHGFGGAQHLGDEYQPLGKSLAHLIHGGNEPIIEDVLSTLASVKSALRLGYRRLDVSLDNSFRQYLEVTHLQPP